MYLAANVAVCLPSYATPRPGQKKCFIRWPTVSKIGQEDVIWSLDRIDQNQGKNGQYDLSGANAGGEGVTVYGTITILGHDYIGA